MTRPAVTDPGDKGSAILSATWVLTALAVLVTLLRIYVRITVARGLCAHDWLMLVASALQVVWQGCVTQSQRSGFGMHDQYLGETWPEVVKWVYISTIPGVLSSIVARISICLLLTMLFGTKAWLKWWLIVTTGLVAVVGVLSISLNFAQAGSDRLDPRIPLYCVYVAGSIFALTDLTFVLFPIMIIWKLNMPARRRIGLCIVMTGSLFTVALCIMRIITARKSDLFEMAIGVLWAGIEQCLVIVLGSAPTLPAVRKLELGFLRSFGTSLASGFSGSGFSGSWRSKDGSKQGSKQGSGHGSAPHHHQSGRGPSSSSVGKTGSTEIIRLSSTDSQEV